MIRFVYVICRVTKMHGLYGFLAWKYTSSFFWLNSANFAWKFSKKSRLNEVSLTYIRLNFVSIDNQNSFFNLFENMFQKCSFENMFQKYIVSHKKKHFAAGYLVLREQFSFNFHVIETLKMSVISRCEFFLSMSRNFLFCHNHFVIFFWPDQIFFFDWTKFS